MKPAVLQVFKPNQGLLNILMAVFNREKGDQAKPKTIQRCLEKHQQI